jgi:hypothetical protein
METKKRNLRDGENDQKDEERKRRNKAQRSKEISSRPRSLVKKLVTKRKSHPFYEPFGLTVCSCCLAHGGLV